MGSGTNEIAAGVLQLMREKNATLGCAESCTGGMIAAALTEIAGSSDVFVGGVVSYWESVKENALGVRRSTIDSYGVVSEQVAIEMAEGASKALNCDYAVSTTGIAGPTGAEPGKPVGTVCYALKTPNKTESITTCEGTTRGEVRALATRNALLLLERALNGELQ